MKASGTMSFKTSREFPMKEGEQMRVRDGAGRVVEIWDCVHSHVGKTFGRHTFKTYGYQNTHFV